MSTWPSVKGYVGPFLRAPMSFCGIGEYQRTEFVYPRHQGFERALTTKLTAKRLDVLGRRWTMCRQKVRIRGQFGQPWTTLDDAPSAPKPQVAGSIPVPPASREY